MAYKELSMDDLMKDQIDARAFDAPQQQEKKAETKRYRTRTGEYFAHCARTFPREVEKGYNAGRRFLSVMMKLYNEDQKYRGTTFAPISWQLKTTSKGDPDLDFRLFQQMVQVLGAPPTAAPHEVCEAVLDQWVKVWGMEMYRVKIKDLLDESYREKLLSAGKNPEWTVNVMVDDDATAESYLDKGYKSEFKVMSIKEIPS